MPNSTYCLILSSWARVAAGPISVSQSSGSPSLIRLARSTRWPTSSSCTRAWASRRDPAMQVCPDAAKIPAITPFIAASSGASSKTMLGDFPPSSSVSRARFCAVPRMMARAVSVPPVKLTLATPGWETSAAPACGPYPVTTFTTPSGNPTSFISRTSSRAVIGVVSAGFSTTVLPAASAGASFQVASRSGEFHGTIIWAAVSRMILPLALVSSSAKRLASCLMRSASRCNNSALAIGEISRQAGSRSARRAAATARSMSTASAAGTDAHGFPVAGLRMSIHLSASLPTNSPPIAMPYRSISSGLAIGSPDYRRYIGICLYTDSTVLDASAFILPRARRGPPGRCAPCAVGGDASAARRRADLTCANEHGMQEKAPVYHTMRARRVERRAPGLAGAWSDHARDARAARTGVRATQARQAKGARRSRVSHAARSDHPQPAAARDRDERAGARRGDAGEPDAGARGPPAAHGRGVPDERRAAGARRHRLEPQRYRGDLYDAGRAGGRGRAGVRADDLPERTRDLRERLRPDGGGHGAERHRTVPGPERAIPRVPMQHGAQQAPDGAGAAAVRCRAADLPRFARGAGAGPQVAPGARGACRRHPASRSRRGRTAGARAHDPGDARAHAAPPDRASRPRASMNAWDGLLGADELEVYRRAGYEIG